MAKESKAKEKLTMKLEEYVIDVQMKNIRETDAKDAYLCTKLSELGPTSVATDSKYYEVEVDGWLFWVNRETLEIISQGKAEPVYPEKIEVTNKNIEVYIGEGKVVDLKLTPNNASKRFIKYTSANEEIATVNNGVVTGIKEGTTEITIESTEDESIKDTCTVTVKAIELTGISLNKTETKVGAGKTETLTVSYTPSNATYKDIKWTTSNSTIATVDENTGLITGIKAGETTVTATSVKYPSVKAECKVTVELVLEIKDETTLYKFAQDVNSGNKYEGYTVKLANNIILNEGVIYSFDKDTGLVEVNKNGSKFYIGTGYKGDTSGSNTTFDSTASKLGVYYLSSASKEETTPIENEITLAEDVKCKEIEINNIKLKMWDPIGNGSNNFGGEFDGQNNKITGLYCNVKNYSGLFGKLNSKSKVKNISIDESLICSSNSYSGTIIGYVDTYCNLENLHSSKGITIGSSNVGGIVGHLQVYDNTTVTKLSNKSEVIGKSYVGGIVGKFYHENMSCTDICTIENSFNTANIYGDAHIGGIAGYIYRGHNAGSSIGKMCINNCYNIGSITGSNYIGGISGGDWPSYIYISNCYNAGNIFGTEYVFGITTSDGNHSLIQNSFNIGGLSASQCAAGISNYAQATNCYNAGIIKATTKSYVGGINSNYNWNYAPSNCHYIKYPEGTPTNGVGTSDNVAGISSYTVDTWKFNVLDVVNTGGQYYTTTSGRDKNCPVLNWEIE